VALNRADQIACRVNVVGRTQAAAVTYATYLLGLGSPTAAQKAWALEVLRVPGEWGERLSWHVVGNANYQTSGSSVTDSDIEYIVQTSANSFYITG
jgi:hypothetical protein